MGCIVHAVEGAVKGVAHAVEGAVEGVVHTVGDVVKGDFSKLPGDLVGDVMSIANVVNPESLMMDAAVGAFDGLTGSSKGGAVLGEVAQVASLVA